MALTGKTAVVTGGSRGIGFEICKILLEQEAHVLAVSRDAAKLEGAHRELPGLATLAADVSAVEDVDRVAAWVRQEWGRLDILVNNAGVFSNDENELTNPPRCGLLRHHAYQRVWPVPVHQAVAAPPAAV